MPPERSPRLADVVALGVSAQLGAMRVALPGRIERWDASAQRADVSVGVEQVYRDEEGNRQTEPFPVIPGVPVLFPGAGGFRVTFPVAVGDTCLLVFSDVSIDKWLAGDGSRVDPEIDASHAIADAVAIVGLRTFGAPWNSCPTDEATIGADGGVQVHFEAGTITAGDKSGAQFVALAQKVTDQLDALKTAIQGWTPVPNDGGAALKTALTALFATWPGDVAATQFKAK